VQICSLPMCIFRKRDEILARRREMQRAALQAKRDCNKKPGALTRVAQRPKVFITHTCHFADDAHMTTRDDALKFYRAEGRSRGGHQKQRGAIIESSGGRAINPRMSNFHNAKMSSFC